MDIAPINKEKRKCQAVVVIHGIGEQRPMSTLRGFVTSLLGYEKGIHKDNRERRTFWTKPDRVSNSYEMRKMTARGRKALKEIEKNGQKVLEETHEHLRSTTHFYEYHWADNMRDTRWRHIFGWIWSLMFRNPLSSHFWRIRFVWVMLWFMVVSTFVFPFVNWSYIFGELPFWMKKTIVFVKNDSRFFYFFGMLSVFLTYQFYKNIILGFVGDAARYLHLDVENIEQRERIRKDGVDLLKALHKTGDYDRIIVVGHSLGSVIAYDIITYLWLDFNKAISFKKGQAKYSIDYNHSWDGVIGGLEKGDKVLTDIEEWSRKNEKGKISQDEAEKVQEAQANFWEKVQYERKSWLISDLITMGSPLAHANVLMADSDADYQLRIEEREYPTNPPALDKDSPKDKGSLLYPSGGTFYLHHATPFAITRWSNVYYKGDIVGGPLHPFFGGGIKDYRVYYSGGPFKRFLSNIDPSTHIHYWSTKTSVKEIENGKEYDTIKLLYKIMRLDDVHSNVYGK